MSHQPLLQEKRPLLNQSSTRKSTKVKPVLVIHGGAGTMTREGSTPERREEYKNALRKALRKGYEVLMAGGEAMDAAVAAVNVMEDCPLFNSGKGAVFNVAGKNELEASIMLSKPPTSHPDIPLNRRGMSLTLLTTTRNPASTARLLYLAPESTMHPFLSGTEAEQVAQSLGDMPVDPSYFYTEARWREHRRGLGLPEEPLPHSPEDSGSEFDAFDDTMPKGTVGAVALDMNGCIAAVTSTGGRTNKLVGRIGDTPHMGAGFWAGEWGVHGLKKVWRKVTRKSTRRAVGVSGTGDGDYFIRYNAAANIADRMKFLGESVNKAANSVVKTLGENEGIGGVIALDELGNYALPLNSSGMYRGVITAESIPRVAIFSDEDLE
ncbi:N-terminal nucleophile aminohydrolase [Fomitiporia mediterranea MF3/22]|uniref:N-terminal nucleophile aminohydrolase n=1 Tax=Fomitiporia mediterranea (strain MF3/22) TaxID=694068 RepID=UPI0004408BA5|nr:N-terminal nucleophile aminohydrolase [Fomitiporia mediterranea MF3/22]EJD02791.1 N-terminal nucleophile aminohydrolase [Fomitiporia mediterranea MF3/22]